MTASPCPACPAGTRAPSRCLCRACWYWLPVDTRKALNQRSGPIGRVRQLLDQLRAGVPLGGIRIE